MGLDVPTGEPRPPPAMSKPRCENCYLDWDAEQGIHGCQSSNIQLRRDQGLGDSVTDSHRTARSRRSQLLAGDPRYCSPRLQALQLCLVPPAAGQCQSQSPQGRPCLTAVIKKRAAFWQSPGAVMRLTHSSYHLQEKSESCYY